MERCWQYSFYSQKGVRLNFIRLPPFQRRTISANLRTDTGARFIHALKIPFSLILDSMVSFAAIIILRPRMSHYKNVLKAAMSGQFSLKIHSQNMAKACKMKMLDIEPVAIRRSPASSISMTSLHWLFIGCIRLPRIALQASTDILK